MMSKYFIVLQLNQYNLSVKYTILNKLLLKAMKRYHSAQIIVECNRLYVSSFVAIQANDTDISDAS